MYRFLFMDSGYRRPVNSWNAVNVRGADGLLQQGTVVGLVSDGLTVDFGCEGQRHQLVKYGDAFSFYRGWFSAPELPPGCAVEVLLRVDRKSPWVWRPATLITTDILRMGANRERLLGLVDVQLVGVGRREVVPFEQLRSPPSPAQLRSHVLQPGDFTVSSFDPLPTAVAAQLSTQIIPLWKVFCNGMPTFIPDTNDTVWPMSVGSSELLLFHRKGTYFAPGENPSQAVLERAQYSLAGSINNKVLGVDDEDRCCWPLFCGSVKVEETAEDSEWTLQNMPHHILAEVLTCMETIELARQRRVCRAFDEMFSMSTDIRLNFRQCSGRRLKSYCDCSELHRHYPLCATLLKYVTPATRRITLTNARPDILASVLHTVEVCGQLGQCMAGRPVLVVAARCHLRSSSFGETMVNLMASVAGGWCKVLFKQCMLDYPLDIGLSGWLQGSADMWELLESQVPNFDVQRTRQWMARSVQCASANRGGIIYDLNEFTARDPRHDNIYAGFDWSYDNLPALDVSKLSRLTLYPLSMRLPDHLFDELPFAHDLCCHQ